MFTKHALFSPLTKTNIVNCNSLKCVALTFMHSLISFNCLKNNY